MNDEISSFLLGTIPLDVMLIIAFYLTITHGAGPPDKRTRYRLIVLSGAAIVVQVVHFTEEWYTGLNVLYPELLGLHPWSVTLWAGFNFVWIAIWCVALVGLLVPWRPALFPIWFLGIACAANGVAHPLLAVAAGGYFPGLWTCPLAGVMGLVLLPRLARFAGGVAGHPA